MALRKGSLKSANFRYNFAIDGGAISTIPMGAFIPAGAIVLGSFIQAINGADLASLGAAVVDINTTAGASIVNNAVSGTTGTYADYNLATYGFAVFAAVTYSMIPVNANGGLIQQFNAASELAVAISAFAITAGSFNCSVLYLEF